MSIEQASIHVNGRIVIYHLEKKAKIIQQKKQLFEFQKNKEYIYRATNTHTHTKKSANSQKPHEQNCTTIAMPTELPFKLTLLLLIFFLNRKLPPTTTKN